MNITFPGAAREVTNSCFLVGAADTCFPTDCGMAQGILGRKLVDGIERLRAECSCLGRECARARPARAMKLRGTVDMRLKKRYPAPRKAVREHRRRNLNEHPFRLGV